MAAGIAQKFVGCLSAEGKQKYKAANYSENRDWRAKWAKEQHKVLLEKNSYIEEWDKVDLTTGSYESFASIWRPPINLSQARGFE